MRQDQDKNTYSIQELEGLLHRAIESVGATDDMLLNMIESYLDMDTTHIKVNENSRTPDSEIKNLELQFKALSELGLKAKINVDELEDFSKAIKKSIASQPDTSNKLTDNTRIELPNSFDELNKTLSILINKFQNDYEVFLEQLAALKRNIFQ